MTKFSLIALAAGLLYSTPILAADYYVDGVNGSWEGNGTKSSAFVSIHQAWKVVQPGDTIHLEPTTSYPDVVLQNESGTSSQWITVIGDGTYPNLTTITGRDASGPHISVGLINDHFIVFRNFEMDGQYESGDRPTYSCVLIQNSDHISIERNYVHNCGGDGIGSLWSDYLKISHNTVTNTSMNAISYRGSGISTKENEDVDSYRGVKIFITGNVVYNNTNKPVPPCDSYSCANDSDGSGIILDDSQRFEVPGSPIPPYQGGTSVTNNIVYNNGGRGISLFHVDHVQIANNTLFHNNTDPFEAQWEPGEITVASAGDVAVYNNILDGDVGLTPATTGPHVVITVRDCTDKIGKITVDYNLLYNTQNKASLSYNIRGNVNPVFLGLHNKWRNPLLLNIRTPDFHLKATSPARSAGFAPMAPQADIDGNSRVGKAVDSGAYQETAAK